MPYFWKFEDKMDEFGIFTNGIDRKTCHRESYMAVMDFEKMEIFLLKEKDNYSLEQWYAIEEYFESISYLSPMNKLTALQIQHLIKEIENVR